MFLERFVSVLSSTSGYNEWKRITYGMIRNKVMEVIATLPPAKTEITAQICYRYSKNRIKHKIVRDCQMARIVCNNHDVLPEASQEDRRGQIIAIVECEVEKTEK
jgi:hypothetical protein